ncbi:hypothetical protein BJ875DRAFT_441720 [Amylocarpus encephaloides]|uniref:Myb-like domain-containing protein n=1 Tax=Amylocarpus encephaloides TaxID=45428 RepID=A0A9P8C4Y2_9HELO|nr:hypothetical protein BJ875DRAFT_441720 [Amylocarpus encephaloides]
MFINASLRDVSKDSGTFVHFQKTDVLHQGLVEMTDNNGNTWSTFGPVATAGTDGWDHHVDELPHNGSFPVASAYDGYSQGTFAGVEGASNPSSGNEAYSAWDQSQPQACGGPSRAQQHYHGAVEFAPYRRSPTSMLQNPQFDWGSYQGQDGQIYHENDNVNIGRPKWDSSLTLAQHPHVHYADYAAANMTLASQPLNDFDMTTAAHNPINSPWDAGPQLPVNERYHALNFQPCHDGLPEMQNTIPEQQLDSSIWTTNVGPETENYSQPSAYEQSISPKLLTLNTLSSALSVSEYSPCSTPSVIYSSCPSIEEDRSDQDTQAAQQTTSQPARRKLPEAPMMNKFVPVLPSNSRSAQANLASTASSKSNTKRESSTAHASTTTTRTSTAKNSTRSKSRKPDREKEDALKRRAPKSSATKSSTSMAAPRPIMSGVGKLKKPEHDYLVRKRLEGVPYKDIKKDGKFTEAESTLRGRFRTLTKPPAERIRKPEWNDSDVRLLRKAIQKLAPDRSSAKVPWKKVAGYIGDNGGSYPFGYATCRRRWDELQEES